MLCSNLLPVPLYPYCWWFRNPENSPVDMVSVSHYLQGFIIDSSCSLFVWFTLVIFHNLDCVFGEKNHIESTWVRLAYATIRQEFFHLHGQFLGEFREHWSVRSQTATFFACMCCQTACLIDWILYHCNMYIAFKGYLLFETCFAVRID